VTACAPFQAAGDVSLIRRAASVPVPGASTNATLESRYTGLPRSYHLT
jgi:hypothetical protein